MCRYCNCTTVPGSLNQRKNSPARLNFARRGKSSCCSVVVTTSGAYIHDILVANPIFIGSFIARILVFHYAYYGLFQPIYLSTHFFFHMMLSRIEESSCDGRQDDRDKCLLERVNHVFV